MSQTLLELADDLRAIDEMWDERGGDGELLHGDDAVVAQLDAWLQDTACAVNIKLDSYAALIRECEARAQMRREEAQRMSELARMDTAKATRLKERLKLFFEMRELSKVETPRFRVSLVANGGKLPLVLDESTDWKGIYNNFPMVGLVEVSYEPDKNEIRGALEDGELLPFARLGERGQSIRIR